MQQCMFLSDMTRRIAAISLVATIGASLVTCSSPRRTSPERQRELPDLVVEARSLSDGSLVPGEPFTLRASVRNLGNGASASTTLRYYRSADTTVSTADTEVGTSAVRRIAALGSASVSVELTAPSSAGTYYYGACVDAVADESDTTDNCSASVKVDVVAPQRRVDVSPRSLTFKALGTSETVTVRILDENGDEDTDAAFAWTSIYPVEGPCCAIKKVDDGLEVTMTKAGNMRIDLSSTDARTASLQVTAYQQATSLEVSPNSISLAVDETDTLSATVRDANGHAIEGRTIYWTTSDSEVATVEGADAGGETGVTATATAVKAGTAVVTARDAGGISGTATVTVAEKTVTGRTDKTGKFIFDFDFSSGSHGFVAGFAEYRPSQAHIYELTSDYRTLPSPLEQQSALFIGATNRSDDLFMFFKGPIDGLARGVRYTVTVSAEIATNVPARCAGAGGAPGESVWVKAGATATEPLSVNDDGYQRMNIDIGIQANSGTQAVVLGDVANSTMCGQLRRWELKSFGAKSPPSPVSISADGRAWVLFGVDSGFEGRTEIYFTQVSVTLTPIASTRRRAGLTMRG